MYGSSFWIVTVKPLACNNLARLAEMIPFPKEEVTPPVTKIYLVGFDIAVHEKLPVKVIKYRCRHNLLS
jgi:hypothetical protein